MNTNNEFDELARQKLGEQVFPFEEAHWLDAQRAIAAQGKRRRGGALWYLGGAAALVIGAWLLWPASGTTVVNDANKVAVTNPEQPVNVVENTVEAPVSTSSNEVPAKDAAAVEVTTNEETRTAGTTIARATEDRTTTTIKRGNNDQGTSATVQPTVPVAPAPITLPHPATPTVTDAVGTTTDVVTTATTTVSSTNTVTMDPLQADQNNGTNTNTGGDEDNEATNDVVNSTTTDAGEDQPAINEPLPPQTQAADTDNSATNDVAPTVDQASATAAAPTPEPTTTDAPVVAVNDSVLAATANDTVAATPEPTPVPPPVIGPRAPWEFGVLGGLFNTTSTYAGGSSSTWDVSDQFTPAFGAEMMHMGRNFGIGSGLHYGTYADRLITPEEYRTVVTTNQVWSIILVDTTVLIITGTDTINGQVVHTGQNVDITVGQLRSDLDSTLSSVRVREASERINRTSYFEVPLLLDAHLVQGRWNFGVRGGPTVGMLTQRQGSIPSDGEGYTDFNDVAMRTWTLGWTARAYVRYRFNSAWSVGIEPAARGQLMDSFEHQGVTRRSTAIGGMISLSYRLP